MIARHLRFAVYWFCAACVLGIPLACGSAPAAELPRYKLAVGQELVYKTTDGKYPAQWTINVVGQNPDGSWRLVFRQKQSFGSGHDRTSEGYFDLAADGRLIESKTLGPMADPTQLFPPLPPDEASLNSAWSATLAFDDTRRELKPAEKQPDAPNECSFLERAHTVFDPIYLFETHREYVFDREQGLVRKITTTMKQGWPARRTDDTSVATVELAESRQLGKSEAESLARDLDQYFAAREIYDMHMADAWRDFAHTAEVLDKAEAALKKIEPELKTTAVQEMLKSKLNQQGQSRSYYLETAERFGKLIGKPSEDWKTEDLDGHPRSLADYQGQIVLLDFWYRGCGWCIRAMPQIKQLAQDFDGQKVAVLGMNNDRNLEDARFVIEKMDLNYPTLKNGDRGDAINTKYAVQGWPTLVMLDRQGVVRHVHVGYSPTLREELGKKIKELLAEN